MMNWTRLLGSDRLCARRQVQDGPARTAFQQDADRILFSSAFRRLQGKTQVYPLPEDDHVHTRLTHSLEVASVGRSIGNRVGEGLGPRHPDLSLSLCDLGDCVHAACLAHDLGNPPFGHSGEDAIRAWFRGWIEQAPGAAELSERQRLDLGGFEGNAQGFRIVTGEEHSGRVGGLQLTHATLGAFTKYPCAAQLQPPPRQGKSTSKLGVYQAELAYFEEVADALGLIPRQGMDSAWCRHPLAFLVEAADDVCYLILDLEDGHRIGYVTHAHYLDLMRPIASRHPSYREGQAEVGDVRQQRHYSGILRALAINVLVGDVAAAFLEREEQILAGEFDGQLTAHSPSAADLELIERDSIRHCYNARDVVQVELAGYDVIAGLLDKLVRAAMEPKRPESKKLRRLFPWLGGGADLYHTLLQITDYVSGMTDSYAVDLYRKLYGLSLPGRR